MSRCTCITASGQLVWDRDCPERLQNQVRLAEQNRAALKGRRSVNETPKPKQAPLTTGPFLCPTPITFTITETTE